jgi:hypothetical protein
VDKALNLGRLFFPLIASPSHWEPSKSQMEKDNHLSFILLTAAEKKNFCPYLFGTCSCSFYLLSWMWRRVKKLEKKTTATTIGC